MISQLLKHGPNLSQLIGLILADYILFCQSHIIFLSHNHKLFLSLHLSINLPQTSPPPSFCWLFFPLRWCSWVPLSIHSVCRCVSQAPLVWSWSGRLTLSVSLILLAQSSTCPLTSAFRVFHSEPFSRSLWYRHFAWTDVQSIFAFLQTSSCFEFWHQTALSNFWFFPIRSFW